MPPCLAPYPDDRWTANIMAEYHNSFPLVPPPHLPYWMVFCPHIPPAWCFLCSTSPPPHLPASVFRSPFISLPPDIHLNIFTQLSTLHDLSSLTATCHHFRIIIQCYATTILRPLLSRLIPAFPSALISIRATPLTTPKPAHWFASLTTAPATLQELATICRLSALTANWQSLWQTSDVVSTPEIAAECFPLPHAVERFNRGCYMALALGVFFPLTEHPDATLTVGFFSWLFNGTSNGVVKQVAWVDDEGYEDATRGVSVFDVGEMRELLLLVNCAEMIPLFLNLADTYMGRPMPRAMLLPDDETKLVRITIPGLVTISVRVPWMHCVAANDAVRSGTGGPTEWAWCVVEALLKVRWGLRWEDEFFIVDGTANCYVTWREDGGCVWGDWERRRGWFPVQVDGSSG